MSERSFIPPAGPVAPADPAAPVFRVDKFLVPAAVLPDFLAQMQRIQGQVRDLPGCLRDLLLTRTGGNGEFNVVRLIEWADAQALTEALPVVQRRFMQQGIDPRAFTEKLGVRADFGFYARREA